MGRKRDREGGRKLSWGQESWKKKREGEGEEERGKKRGEVGKAHLL